MSATQIIGNTDNRSTLAAALQATGQNAVLDDDATTSTVFAPANAAFDNIDVQSLTDTPDLTRDLLNFHIVQGEALTASDLEGRQSVTTVEGQELSIGSQDGMLTVGGIPVSQADVEASNGVAHVIGGVLVPDSFPRRTSDDLAAQSNAGAIRTASRALSRSGRSMTTSRSSPFRSPTDLRAPPYRILRTSMPATHRRADRSRSTSRRSTEPTRTTPTRERPSGSSTAPSTISRTSTAT